MENEGVFSFHVLQEIGDLLREGMASVVKRTCYVGIVASLLVPIAQIQNTPTKDCYKISRN